MIETSTLKLTKDQVKTGIYFPELKGTHNRFFTSMDVWTRHPETHAWTKNTYRPSLEERVEFFSLAAVEGSQGRWGLIDLEQMRMLTPCKFDEIILEEALRQYLTDGNVGSVLVTLDGETYDLYLSYTPEHKTSVRKTKPAKNKEVAK